MELADHSGRDDVDEEVCGEEGGEMEEEESVSLPKLFLFVLLLLLLLEERWVRLFLFGLLVEVVVVVVPFAELLLEVFLSGVVLGLDGGG
jgi:hypothetical protein